MPDVRQTAFDIVHRLPSAGTRIDSCSRLLPTTRPHLYPGLLHGACAPSGPRIHEWTCCTVAPLALPCADDGSLLRPIDARPTPETVATGRRVFGLSGSVRRLPTFDGLRPAACRERIVPIPLSHPLPK